MKFCLLTFSELPLKARAGQPWKRKTTKLKSQQKSAQVSESTQSGNMGMGTCRYVGTTARAWLAGKLECEGWGRKPLLQQKQRTQMLGSKMTVMLSTAM